MSARDGHLGDHAAALVDGALDGAARDRALAHITGCIECRREVDQQRRLKQRLRHSGDPSLPSSLTDRLRAIGLKPDGETSRPVVSAGAPPAPATPVPAMPTTATSPTATSPTPMPKPRVPVPAAGRRPGGSSRPSATPGRIPGTRSRRSHRLRPVTGGVGVVALGIVAALSLGPARNEGPAVSPPIGAYEVEHARTTGGVAGVGPGAGAVVTVSANR